MVANPPYITPKDRALNQAYRDRYSTCHMKYSLAVPFLERIVSLAVEGGFTGQITANSFMKREFGKKLIEEFFPRVDLTHVIDTSGAYIPGHGTPTVILFARNRRPVASTIRTVMGIRGEPTRPTIRRKGLVWSAIVAQIDQPGSQSEFVSVGDSPRELFHKHPWSIGGGGAAELKEQLDERLRDDARTSSQTRSDYGAFTREDDAVPVAPSRHDASTSARRTFDRIGRWVTMSATGHSSDSDVQSFPYDDESRAAESRRTDARSAISLAVSDATSSNDRCSASRPS